MYAVNYTTHSRLSAQIEGGFMDTIELSFKLNVGHAGVDDDPLNPLSRALQVPMKEGRPNQGYALCFYSGEERDLKKASLLRWLGIFVLSVDERIIFFPGFSQIHTWIQTTTNKSTSYKKSFDLDHISLEPNKKSWHFTSADSNHISGGQAQDLDKGRLSWVGLSIASENILRQVLSTTVAIFPLPSTDVNRRIKFLKDKQNKASQNYVFLMNGSKDKFKKGFLHFCFTVIPHKQSYYKGSVWLTPYGSQNLSQPFPKYIRNLQKAIHRIQFFGLYDIQISCMWLPGELSFPCIWTT